METLFFNGTECHTYGKIPAVGTAAPAFTLTGSNLQPVSSTGYPGKKIVLNIFPSLDTAVCAMSVRRFNKEAAALPNVQVICVSMDLPFAAARFCSAEGIENVIAASAFRSPKFVEDYGVKIVDGPLEGLLARCVLIIDENGVIAYRDVVEEITHEPNYKEAIDVLKKK